MRRQLLLNAPIPLVRGRTIALSPPRRFIGDLLYFARRVPTVPAQRRMRLADVVDARSRWRDRVSWCSIFLKAYSVVAAQRPELRRAYLSFPWPRLYEHPENVASFSLERIYQGEPSVFYARLRRPEQHSLAQIDTFVRAHKAAPLESIDSFRHALRLSRLPRFARRLVWRAGLDVSGAARARYFGTFAVSVVAAFGAASLHILSPLTTTLNYSPFEPDGSIDVRLSYDHRVLDGAVVARALVALEAVLHGEIRDELRAGPPVDRGDLQRQEGDASDEPLAV